jgi:hypothetical protein
MCCTGVRSVDEKTELIAHPSATEVSDVAILEAAGVKRVRASSIEKVTCAEAA